MRARHAVRVLVYLCCAALPLAQARQQVDDELTDARAATAALYRQISQAQADAVAPGNAAPPAQSTLAGKDLDAAARAYRSACAARPNDVICQANLAAFTFAETPHPTLGTTGAQVAAVAGISGTPGTTLGSLASYYSGCAHNGACKTDVYCIGAACFDTKAAADPDFAAVMSYMEAAREAGVYIDPATLRVFAGEAAKCTTTPWHNCCTADARGKGMSNQSMYGVGSGLVYDTLMDNNNRNFVLQGMQSLWSGADMSGSFSTYGFTVAADGASIPAGSTVLASGEGWAVAVDPTTLAIAVAIYVITQMMSCTVDEAKLGMREGAGLCHTVGQYCSRCLMLLGACVSCTEETTGKCCYNSLLARLINEQGRGQLRLDWGTPKAPLCDGFTVTQLQRLDFSAMDLSEFYASLAPRMPDAAALGAQVATKATNCYYGTGKCAQ